MTNEITEKIEIEMRSHPGPNQVYVIEFGSNNMRKTTKPALEVAKIVSRYRRIMAEAQKAKVRVLLCGTIPDPRPAVDSKLKLLDEALEDLEMGEGNKFLALRGSMLDAQGKVRTDIFKPRGDIHLNVAGTQIASLRIRKMLEVMIPTLVQAPAPAQVQTPPAPVRTPPATAPVQTPAKPQRVRILAPFQDPAPVVVNTPPVVDAPLVAEVVNVPAVVPVAVQNIVPEQDQVESMETDEDELLAKLFFKKYGRALLDEKEKEKEDDVDNIKFVIDLTDESDEMEVAAPVVVVKTEPIEVAKVTEVAIKRRVSSRLERLELAKARKAITEFGKSLRKTAVIPEKEVPENVIATDDTDMAEANPVESVNPVGSVNTIESAEQIIAESDRRAEQIIDESDAAIAASQREFVAEFRDVPLDEFDEDDLNIEPLC